MEERQPISPIDEFVAELENPDELRQSLGLPHPLSPFGIAGKFNDGLCADILLEFIQDAIDAMEDADSEKDSGKVIGARWMLLESEKAFYFACAEAGIDGDKLRMHLQERLGQAVKG